MKINYKKGKKSKDDRIIAITTSNEEWFRIFKLALLTNQLAINEWKINAEKIKLTGNKGKPFFNNTKWSTLISEKRTEHSAKPEIFYKMVDEICAGRKLDYFARKKRDGWDVYGDEIKKEVLK